MLGRLTEQRGLVGLITALVVIGAFAGVSWVVIILLLVAMLFLHELGHYLTARWTGMKVTEFFIGFGPRLWSFRRGDTEYGVKAIWAGAYVRIVGIDQPRRGGSPRRAPQLPRAELPPQAARADRRIGHALRDRGGAAVRGAAGRRPDRGRRSRRRRAGELAPGHGLARQRGLRGRPAPRRRAGLDRRCGPRHLRRVLFPGPAARRRRGGGGVPPRRRGEDRGDHRGRASHRRGRGRDRRAHRGRPHPRRRGPRIGRPPPPMCRWPSTGATGSASPSTSPSSTPARGARPWWRGR